MASGSKQGAQPRFPAWGNESWRRLGRARGEQPGDAAAGLDVRSSEDQLLSTVSSVLRGSKPARRERYAHAASLREDVPLDQWGDWAPAPDRENPITILQRQEADRVQSLLPLRYQRMGVDSFTFLRGSAAVMAADLATLPTSGVVTQACGDAHLTNFGLFAAPDRRLLFDLNDFDEALSGPFEWDVARLAASVAVAAQVNGASPKKAEQLARDCVRAYRTTMHEAEQLSTLLLWYYRIEEADVLSVAAGSDLEPAVRKAARKASRRRSGQAVRKLTEVVGGQRRFVSEPMVVIPLREADVPDLADELLQAYVGYLSTIHSDKRQLLSHFRFVDVAHKTVGVGSVGTRALVMLLESGDGEPLILQLKQANASVLNPHVAAGLRWDGHQGERVVRGQRLLQSGGDPFLGFNADPPEGTHHFYFRQLKDMKGSIDPNALSPKALRRYGELCGIVLARAHARAGDPSQIAGYLGTASTFERAMGRFARRYAEVTRADHAAMQRSHLGGFNLS